LGTQTFSDLGLSPKVLSAIEAAGYSTPTPIQAEAIPVALTGTDVLGIAQTGTGKTASFTLPMITRLESGRARARMPRSLILAPTRELAAQVAESFEKYGINHKLNVALLIGGVSMNDQVKKLDRGVDVLIATPGRLMDHFQRGRLMLMGVEILVIDEADRMLDMGFIPDIEKICKLLPPRRQNLFFSATMPTEITRLVQNFMKNPTRIEVARPATTAETITQQFQYCGNCGDSEKRDILRELIRSSDVKNAIIFCNRKRDVAILHKSLLKHGFNAGALHGDMDQRSRMETLAKFRDDKITLLAASDVAARGLDIPNVSHIFNYDLPWQSDDYVHRIGRTGRAGRTGTATSLVTGDDFKILNDIENNIGGTITWLGDAPTEDEIARGGMKKRRGGRGRSADSNGRQREAPERGPRRDRSKRTQTANDNSNRGTDSIDEKPSTRDDDQQRQRPPRRRRASARTGTGTPAQVTEMETASASPAADSRSPTERTNKRSGDNPAPASRQRTRKTTPHKSGRTASPSSDETRVTAPAAGFADNVPAFLRRPPR